MLRSRHAHDLAQPPDAIDSSLPIRIDGDSYGQRPQQLGASHLVHNGVGTGREMKRVDAGDTGNPLDKNASLVRNSGIPNPRPAADKMESIEPSDLDIEERSIAFRNRMDVPEKRAYFVELVVNAGGVEVFVAGR